MEAPGGVVDVEEAWMVPTAVLMGEGEPRISFDPPPSAIILGRGDVATVTGFVATVTGFEAVAMMGVGAAAAGGDERGAGAGGAAAGERVGGAADDAERADATDEALLDATEATAVLRPREGDAS